MRWRCPLGFSSHYFYGSHVLALTKPRWAAVPTCRMWHSFGAKGAAREGLGRIAVLLSYWFRGCPPTERTKQEWLDVILEAWWLWRSMGSGRKCKKCNHAERLWLNDNCHSSGNDFSSPILGHFVLLFLKMFGLFDIMVQVESRKRHPAVPVLRFRLSSHFKHIQRR